MNAELNVDPLSWLKFTFRGGLDASTDDRVYFFPKLSAGAVNGELFQDDITENEFNFDAIAKGSFNLADGVSMLATVGWNYNNQKRDLSYTSIVGFLVAVHRILVPGKYHEITDRKKLFSIFRNTIEEIVN